MAKPQPRQGEQEILEHLIALQDDPLAFVMFAFPWGEPNTPLANQSGPRDWQVEALTDIRNHVIKNRQNSIAGFDPTVLQMARASGRGIGKSAFLAWVALWMFCTVPTSTTIVSANTEQQLKSTTFPEIKKWATMSIMNTWFDYQAMSIRPSDWLTDTLKQTTSLDDSYWFIQARLWSEESPDAYAGLHSQAGMAVLFDEASGIPSVIWPVAAGFFTDKTIHRIWVAISNPRNPSGAFFECFNKNRNLWNTATIDARSIRENDQTTYENIIQQFGPDSDEARVEVYGQFPRQGDQQFIGRGVVSEAVQRKGYVDTGAPLVIGVDPARFGDDEAVIAFRQGNDARVAPFRRYKRCDLTELADHVVEAVNEYNPAAVFVEGDGVGGGLADILKRQRVNVIEVTMGGKAQDSDKYANHRTEVWARMRDWLDRSAIPEDERLVTDLTAPEYGYTTKGQLRLEPKDKMKKRGYDSPDSADALAVTFSRVVARTDRTNRVKRRVAMARDVDYDLFGG